MNNKFSFTIKKMERTETIDFLFFIKTWKNLENQISRNHDLPAHIFIHNKNYRIAEIYWYKDGKPDRKKDLPAVIYRSGNRYWYKEGIYAEEKLFVPRRKNFIKKIE